MLSGWRKPRYPRRFVQRFMLLACMLASLFAPSTAAWGRIERLDVGVQAFRAATFDLTVLAKHESTENPDGDPAEAAHTEQPADLDHPTEPVTLAEPGADLGQAALAQSGALSKPEPLKPFLRFLTLFAHKPAGERPSQVVESRDQSLSPISLIQTAWVERHIQYFQTSKREHFDQWLARLNHYKPIIEKIFAQFQLPTDLMFLSLIESGFNPHAYSRARAVGPWQFIKTTGRLYGLRIDEYVDERRDPIKSTVAAARYLRDLYDLFGTWPLALAAYNAGEGTILRALEKVNAKSFWDLAQTKFIRQETREYVPRFLAAALIAKNPDEYGFRPAVSGTYQFDEVVVTRPLHLRAIALATGIPYEELCRLNPELSRHVTPPGDPAYHLKVPVGSRHRVEQVLASIATWSPPGKVAKVRKSPRSSYVRSRVRRGDSLSKLAKHVHTTVAELNAHNRLAGRSIKVSDLLHRR